MKKSAKKVVVSDPLTLEYPDRLSALEAEIWSYPARTADSPAASVPSIGHPKVMTLGREPVVQFTCGSETYAVGHTDTTFAGANHARGVRHIHFYDEAKTLVFGIAGDFEAHMLGVNFGFRSIETYVAGSWEKPFLAMTDTLRTYRAKKREAFRKHRAALTKSFRGGVQRG